ncbi:MAG: Oxidoreductase domain protein [Thermotogales bacterium 46_20]|nr:MAG: Oxidoreductase domain protein [Thermotogales bacterium 46_20]
MKRLRAALIGCGRISKKHIEAFVSNKDLVDLVAVCDIVPEKAHEAAEAYQKLREVEMNGREKQTRDSTDYSDLPLSRQPVSSLSPTSRESSPDPIPHTPYPAKPEVVTDYRRLCDSDIDFVSIATESGKHYQISMDFLKAGKHVLVEKPMAMNLEQADHMIEQADKSRVKLGVVLQNRFNPPIVELRKKVEDGSFGRIFNVTARILWNRNEAYYKQASWRGTWESDGGALLNQCSHNIDLLQWMLNDRIKSVYAVTKNFNHPYIETEDFGAAIVETESGRIGIVEGTVNVFPKNLEETLSVFGEKGTVVIGGVAVNRIQTWKFEGEEEHPLMHLPDPETVYGNGHNTQIRDFVLALFQDRNPSTSGEEGRKSLEAILTMHKASKTKTRVDLP